MQHSHTSVLQRSGAARAVGSKQQKLTRTILDVDQISDLQREFLSFQLFEIFSISFGGVDFDTVCNEIIFKEGGRLALYFDDSDRIAGFATHRIDRVEIDGSTNAIVECGTYFRPGVRGGGKRAVNFGLVESLRFKLRNPSTPLFYVCEALTPITYRAMAAHLTVWPNRHQKMPFHYVELLNKVLSERGFDLDAARPFIVRYDDPAVMRRPGRLARSKKAHQSSDVRFYIRLNPHFADGDILCTLVPLDLKQILSGLLSLASHAWKRRK